MSSALSNLSVKKVIRALDAVGFDFTRTKGSHAVHRNADGRTVTIPCTAQ
ncbi:hypothetical protein UO65_1185 [Actinokineospora spheciospongiae]|uniref:YcfA family protein n=1 Tax=Actinokineospora spheciospongiae TaxID=909613 RepID=W7IT09_9PSEU|nr:type II toxin-antitoxin system HicA family toxin [Actinokineospora spheciospongiae]EWC63508.1 hypothetical protein UO65_1185 [Actinokineospora spheciospongiae]PWW64258.1 HicA-like toxin of HicAB toxin-antitoxin system [Actinokineospora spheciospongiae]